LAVPAPKGFWPRAYWGWVLEPQHCSRWARSAFAQQGAVSLRPLTHDLFRDVLEAVNIRLLSARITSLVNGIFFSDLVLSNGSNVSARASDAVALAIRTGAAIEVATEILEEVGVEIPGDQASASG
jgi:bifunctional DNase/RNase